MDSNTLRAMDIVLVSELDIVTRIKVAFNGFFSRLMPTKAYVVLDLYNNKVMAGFDGKRVRLYSLDNKHIVCVRRHFVYNETRARKFAQYRIMNDIVGGLNNVDTTSLKITKIRSKNFKRIASAEYVYMQTAIDGIKYPDNFANSVTPLQLSNVHNGLCDIEF